MINFLCLDGEQKSYFIECWFMGKGCFSIDLFGKQPFFSAN